MGAVPVLILLAAVGVDYGWQPDGTTSQRGDNVEYIIQIPPHQLDQIRSAGEITSTIDPSIQGRVSRIVVKIGTAMLPKDAGRVTATAEDAPAVGAAAAADDAAQIPIPEIAADSLAQTASDRATTPASESLMKPDPQAGGFAFPDNLQNSVRTNPAVSTQPAAAPSSRPSTDPVDPTSRQQATTWPSFGNTSLPSTSAATIGAPSPAAQPMTTGAGGATFGNNNPSAATAGTSGNRPTDPSDPSWSGYGTTPNFGTMPPGLAPSAGIMRPQPGAQLPSSTDYANQALDTQRTGTATASPRSNTEQTTGLGSSNNQLDRLGRPIDSLGRLIDPETGYLVDASGSWIDEYGRPIDRLGRPLSREPANSAAPVYGQPAYAQPGQPAASNGAASGQTNPAYAGGYQPAPGYSPNMAYPPATAFPAAAATYQGNVPYPAQPPYQTAATTFPNPAQPINYTPPAAAADPRQAQSRVDSRTGGAYDEDHSRSPSDSRLGASARSDSQNRGLERDVAEIKPSLSTGGRSRTVAAQPFFNFVLLISLVGNAYLIYETGNLRRKFRSMIANVRASKLSAQPAG